MKVKFLLAEEIRQEVEGKLTILGFFANNTVLISKRPADVPEDVPAALERLTILAVVSEASDDGVHKFKGTFFDPSNNVYKPEQRYGEAAIPKGFSHSLIIELKPFVVPVMGTYQFEFYVDDKKFTFLFEFRERPL